MIPLNLDPYHLVIRIMPQMRGRGPLTPAERFLERICFLDNLQGGQEGVDAGDVVTFRAELDRVYCGAPDDIEV